jgi:predicted NACHT family NTPase
LIFITLKEFAEAKGQPDLPGFMAQQLTECGIEHGEAVIERILHTGRSIVLLDGLDEVRDQDHDRILKTIRRTEEMFPANKFVITCRIAAKEYTFEQFTEVEVTDFNDEQIVNFSRNWFQPKDPIKAEEFPRELKSSPGLQELAINPLLLTLLCLVFEDGGRFPTNRSELYKQGLDILLRTWDASRNIQRKCLYGQLSLKRKEDLLSQIAYNTFERSDYFFRQNSVEEQIQQYIQNFPFASTEQEILEIDSENVLKEIAAHHGLLVERATRIYSFSHLTFQEYFTACFIKEKADGDFGDIIIRHITNKQWREVFLLTVEMLQNADRLLQGMKQKIDDISIQNNRLQNFLKWVEKKSESTNNNYKMSAIRAFYLAEAHTHPLTYARAHHLDFALDLARILDSDFNYDLACTIALAYTDARIGALARSHASTFALDLVLSNALVNALALSNSSTFDLVIVKALNLDPALALEMESTNLSRSLQQLKDRLPDSFLENLNDFQHWWRENGQKWSEQLRAIMINHRNIGHNWQFSENTLKLIQQYYDANKLLVDCLESDCYVSRKVREEIESTLLRSSG